VLVLSKLYLVTRGALVPEMAAADEVARRHPGVDEAGWPAADDRSVEEGFAGFNAQLTLLGTLAGFAVSIPGIVALKVVDAEAVLVLAAIVFGFAAAWSLRLRVASTPDPDAAAEGALEEDREGPAQPIEDNEVVLGLTAAATLRFAAGFLTFLVAFELRRQHSPLYWFGLAFAASGVGALVGLALVSRIRTYVSEQVVLMTALAMVAGASALAASAGTLPAQVALAGIVALAGALGQPSFDALTQRRVPPQAQGRVFARLAVRQQLTWVLGALIPVAIAMSFVVGDALLGAITACSLFGYVTGRLVWERGRR
jgi:hypothetical protein